MLTYEERRTIREAREAGLMLPCKVCVGAGLDCSVCQGTGCDLHTRLRWMACEACGGSGEIIRREPGARDPSDEYAELCGACEGTGRDCVED